MWIPLGTLLIARLALSTRISQQTTRVVAWLLLLRVRRVQDYYRAKQSLPLRDCLVVGSVLFRVTKVVCRVESKACTYCACVGDNQTRPRYYHSINLRLDDQKPNGILRRAHQYYFGSRWRERRQKACCKPPVSGHCHFDLEVRGSS